jgi:hypothetical protein
MSAMIPLFGDKPKSRWNWVEITIRAVSINLAGAIASSILALCYFAVAFAAGEASRTLPTSVIVILAVTVVAVAAVGAVLAFIARHFPWLAVILIPLFLGLVFSTGAGDFRDWAFGGICSAVYLAGAVIGRIAKNRMRMRKRVGPAAQTE